MSKTPKTASLNIEPSDSTLKRNTAENESNFVTSEDNFIDDVWRSPGKIPEQEKIEIIQRGFQLNQERKISLKKYYESTEEYNLFQLKKYSIKYETI